MDESNKQTIDDKNNISDVSLEEYIKHQKKKQAKKTKIIILISAIAVIIIAIIVTSNVISENNKKKAMEEVTADVTDIAEKYNIDLVCVEGSKDSRITFTSDSFADLTADKMNSVFMDFEDEKGYDVDWGFVEILSQGLRYRVKSINAGYKTISDYSKYGNGSEYDNITSKISYESGDHILELDDNKMTCNIIRRYRYDNTTSSSSSSSSSKSGSVPAGKKVCSRCSGTGKVTKHFGNSWNKKPGYGYGDVCGACGGTGYVSE